MTKTMIAALALLFSFSVVPAGAAQGNIDPKPYDQYAGCYELSRGEFISVARWEIEKGFEPLLFTDFKSGRIGVLSRSSDDAFTCGPGLLVNAPVAVKIQFIRNTRGEVVALTYQQGGSQPRSAKRIKLNREDVSFKNGAVTLSGTLSVPSTKGPHPAVVLIHGSGELGRHSFGPFAYFFASRGFAVLTYDKRGTHNSTGDLAQATFDELAADALAGVRFLSGRSDINRKQIGLWGPSQGGFLSIVAASHSKDVAFAINYSGMIVPAWKQDLYRVEAEARADGLSSDEIAEAVAFTKLQLEVGRTGEGWERFEAMMQQSKDKDWFRYVYVPESLERARLAWRT